MKPHCNKLTIAKRSILTVMLAFFISSAFNASAQAPQFDYVPDLSAGEIKERLASLDYTIPLTYNDKVKSFIDYFTVRDRNYTRRMLSHKELYFPIFEEYLAKHQLPDELKYLSIVESGLNPKAISRAGAGGLWQFMPATGRMYQLNLDWYIDDRLDPYASTEAACKYLKSLYFQFNDWHLALAAYNTGPGNVRKAIKRAGGKQSFWEIYNFLPRETRSYVPQFIAVTYAMNFAEDHNLWGEEEYPMAFDTIRVNQYLHIETLAEQIGICTDDILKLNPQIKRGAVPESRKNFVLRIPADAKPYLSDRLAILDSASKVGKVELAKMAENVPGGTTGRDRIVHKVRSGEVLGRIAAKYNVRVADIQTWNKLSGNTIYVGQNLNIYVYPTKEVASATKPATTTSTTSKPITTSVASATPGQSAQAQYYKVQPGDTLWAISRKYPNLTIDEIKKLNNLNDNNIKVGQMLLVSSK